MTNYRMVRKKGKDGKYHKVPQPVGGSSGKRSRAPKGRLGGGRSYVNKHRKSLGILLAVGGIAAVTTAVGAKGADTIVAFIAGVASRLGYTGPVDGTTIVAAYLFVCAAAAASPWVGHKVNTFLGRWGLKL